MRACVVCVWANACVYDDEARLGVCGLTMR